jgi:hypothetical protein
MPVGDVMGAVGRPPATLLEQVSARLVGYDDRLRPEVMDGALVIAEPATGWPVTLGIAGDGRGSSKLHASARVDRTLARVLGSNLGRMLGMVQVLPLGNEAEVRRWSPYRPEDIDRTPQEAVDWSVTTIETMLEELRARGRVVPQGQLTLPEPRPPVVESPVAPPDAPKIDTEAVQALERRIAEVEQLNASIGTELAAARADLAKTQGQLETALRERDAAVALSRDLAERPHGSDDPAAPTAPTIDPVPNLVSTFDLLAEAGSRTSTLIEVLRRFLEIAPDDPRLREELGIYLLRDDQVQEALSILGGLGADGLTPRGASALVEASFRQKTLPDDLDILGRVDWRMGNVATYLRDMPTWVPRDQLLDITQVIGQSGPPQFGAYLQAVATMIAPAQTERLFAVWFDLDPTGSLDQLLGWLDAKKVGMGQAWVRDAVELAADDEDRRIARRALDLLVNDAADRHDADALLDLVDSARGHMKASDWRAWAIGWLREAASAGGSQGPMDRCAAMTLEVLRDSASVREEDAEYGLAVVLEPKVSHELAVALRSELDRLRPVDITVRDVTTVSEALKATEERYPGLVVLPDARKSAEKRGTVGVSKAREALFALGEVADRYARGELDEGLDEALAVLPGFKPDISDSAKKQYRQHYLKQLPGGGKVMLGPHIDIGGGDAGRAYFAIDRASKRIILGHAGEHLPGKRDT